MFFEKLKKSQPVQLLLFYIRATVEEVKTLLKNTVILSMVVIAFQFALFGRFTDIAHFIGMTLTILFVFAMFTFAPKKKTKERAKKDSLLPRPYFSPCPHMLLDHVDTIELRICFGCREMRFFLPDGTTSKAFKARKAAFEYLAAYYGERDRDATFWEIFEAIETSGFPIGATQREIAGIE